MSYDPVREELGQITFTSSRKKDWQYFICVFAATESGETR